MALNNYQKYQLKSSLVHKVGKLLKNSTLTSRGCRALATYECFSDISMPKYVSEKLKLRPL